MSAQSSPKSFSCLPCARRKVRCDRKEPCSHCKRRKVDICEYPVETSRLRETQLRTLNSPENGHTLNLEDDNGAHRDSQTPTSQRHAALDSLRNPDDNLSSHVQGTKRKSDGESRINAWKSSRPRASIVQLEKEPSYVEVPVWYTWSEARKVAEDPYESRKGADAAQLPRQSHCTGYSTTLLDPPKSRSTPVDCLQPQPEQVRALWEGFLSNVHPVVKLFFDWDKEPIIETAATDPASLSPGQRALCFAIYFITTLSFSDEECATKIGRADRLSVIDDFQVQVESALLTADYASTSNIVVLQAFVLYIIAMRNRAKPTASFSMAGIAIRIAQRLGLHRDGDLLGFSPMQAEERRRIWWQLQHTDISISQLIGTVSMTLYCEWDAKLPANLEDDDVKSEMDTWPTDRPGLTSMSHCLWRYYVLYLHRSLRDPKQGAVWLTPGSPSSFNKDAMLERYRRPLAEKFLQYCEPVNPLHVHLQIGIQNFLLALQRGTRQPGLATNSSMSEMSQDDRDEMLKICIKSMDYFILGQTTPSIAHLRWHNENYFQWTAFVYIVIEALERANNPQVQSLWTLIDKVYETFPKLSSAISFSEVQAVGRLALLAWQRRQSDLSDEQKLTMKPSSIVKLEQVFDVSVHNVNSAEPDPSFDLDGLGPFGFDLIDWSVWEKTMFSSSQP